MMVVKTIVISLMTLLAKTGALDEFSVEGATSQQDTEGGIADVDWAADQADGTGSDEGATEERSSEGGAHRHDGWARNRTSDARQDTVARPKKTDWCKVRAWRHAQGHENVRYPMHRALEGHHLRAGVSDFRPFLIVDESAPEGVGPGMRFDGPLVVEFNKLAAKYNVRVTYEALPPIHRNRTTIGRYLQAHVEHYDLILGAFVDTPERRRLALEFTSPVLDLSYSLYMRRGKTSRNWLQFFCIRLFDYRGLLGFVMSCIIPSLLWQAMCGQPRNAEEQWWFLGIVVVLGVRGPLAKLQAKRWPVRVFLMLWAVSAFVAIASVSTSMSRAVQTEGQERPPVKGLDDFGAQGYTLCLPENLYQENLVRSWFHGPMVPKPREDLAKAVADSECMGILERKAVAELLMKGGQPQTLPSDPQDTPFGCDLVEVGPVILERNGAFVTTLDDCKSFVKDVIQMWINRDNEGKRSLAGEIGLLSQNSGVELSTGRSKCGPARGAKRLSFSHFGEVVIFAAVVMIPTAMYVASLQE